MTQLIYSYTRAQAIADGVLVDVSELAREAGYRFPVAITQTLWCECIQVHDDDVGQNETGRLWDVLNVLRQRIQTASSVQVVFFDVLIARGGRGPQVVRLKAHCGPGDDLEPVLTLMMPGED